jgi:alkyldihydroxyacetonephosphate synthase
VSADRILIGSEGALGIITEAWVRVRRRPVHRASTPVRFDDFMAGAQAVRALSQSGLYPTNCRLIDAREAEITGAHPPGDGRRAVLMLGFESAEHDVERRIRARSSAAATTAGRVSAAMGPGPQTR